MGLTVVDCCGAQFQRASFMMLSLRFFSSLVQVGTRSMFLRHLGRCAKAYSTVPGGSSVRETRIAKQPRIHIFHPLVWLLPLETLPSEFNYIFRSVG